VISVRQYILTQRERKILEAFIESNSKLDGFSILVIRLKRASKRIMNDVALIKGALEKLEKE